MPKIPTCPKCGGLLGQCFCPIFEDHSGWYVLAMKDGGRFMILMDEAPNPTQRLILDPANPMSVTVAPNSYVVVAGPMTEDEATKLIEPPEKRLYWLFQTRDGERLICVQIDRELAEWNTELRLAAPSMTGQPIIVEGGDYFVVSGPHTRSEVEKMSGEPAPYTDPHDTTRDWYAVRLDDGRMLAARCDHRPTIYHEISDDGSLTTTPLRVLYGPTTSVEARSFLADIL